MNLLYKTHWLSRIWCKFCQYLLAVHIQCHHYHDHNQQHFQATRASTFNKSARSSIHTAASGYRLYFIVRHIIIITVCVRLAYCYKTATFMAAELKLIWRLRGLLLALSALETNSTVSHHWRSLGSLSLLTVDSKSCCVGIAFLLFLCQKLLQRLVGRSSSFSPVLLLLTSFHDHHVLCYFRWSRVNVNRPINNWLT